MVVLQLGPWDWLLHDGLLEFWVTFVSAVKAAVDFFVLINGANTYLVSFFLVVLVVAHLHLVTAKLALLEVTRILNTVVLCFLDLKSFRANALFPIIDIVSHKILINRYLNFKLDIIRNLLRLQLLIGPLLHSLLRWL